MGRSLDRERLAKSVDGFRPPRLGRRETGSGGESSGSSSRLGRIGDKVSAALRPRSKSRSLRREDPSPSQASDSRSSVEDWRQSALSQQPQLPAQASDLTYPYFTLDVDLSEVPPGPERDALMARLRTENPEPAVLLWHLGRKPIEVSEAVRNDTREDTGGRRGQGRSWSEDTYRLQVERWDDRRVDHGSRRSGSLGQADWHSDGQSSYSSPHDQSARHGYDGGHPYSSTQATAQVSHQPCHHYPSHHTDMRTSQQSVQGQYQHPTRETDPSMSQLVTQDHPHPPEHYPPPPAYAPPPSTATPSSTATSTSASGTAHPPPTFTSQKLMTQPPIPAVYTAASASQLPASSATMTHPPQATVSAPMPTTTDLQFLQFMSDPNNSAAILATMRIAAQKTAAAESSAAPSATVSAPSMTTSIPTVPSIIPPTLASVYVN